METKEIQVKDGLEGSVGTALTAAAQNGVRVRPFCIGAFLRGGYSAFQFRLWVFSGLL